MEIQGKIKLIKEVQEISATFKKRELILTTDEQYPQTLSSNFIFNYVPIFRRSS